VNRSSLLAVVGVISVLGCWTNAAYGQSASAPRLVSVITPAFSVDSEEAQAFREALRGAGYVDGRDVSIDWWYGHGRYDGVANAVANAVQRKADVIVAESLVAASAARHATQTIPIVMAYVGDPVGSGLVESLAHPGGNVTGVTTMAAELAPKRLQLLKEAVPSATRIGVLWNPDTPFHSRAVTYLKSAAPQLRVAVVPVAFAKVDQLEPAFSAFARSKVDAVMVLGDPFMFKNSIAIIQLAAKNRLPLAFDYPSTVKQGVLLSSWIQTVDSFRHAARYVDKILKGATPAALPVEQPTKFELIIDLKTAKHLGLTIPESVLLQATEVIR